MSFEKDGSNCPSRNGIAQSRRETNLYLCKADIFLQRTQIPTTRKCLEKIFSHIDPGWKFIRIRDNKCSPLNTTDKQFTTDSRADNEETSVQALSVILFLNEEQYQEVLGTIHSETDVWQLRHTIKLLNGIDGSTVIGCMNFYEYSQDLPLCAISPIHFGSKVLRFNIFVKDFETMREYYEKLILQQCHFVRKGFGIFQVHSYPGLEVQISLKSELRTELRPTKSAVLRLKFRKLDVARCNSVATLEEVNPRVWRTKDPEGNVILLEEIGTESRGKITKRRSKSEATKDELVFV
jgi:hypothetical protein